MLLRLCDHIFVDRIIGSEMLFRPELNGSVSRHESRPTLLEGRRGAVKSLGWWCFGGLLD